MIQATQTTYSIKNGMLSIGSSSVYLLRTIVEVEVNGATDGLYSKPQRLEFYFSSEDLPQQVSVHLAQIQSLSHVHFSPGRTCGRLVGAEISRGTPGSQGGLLFLRSDRHEI